MGATTFVVESRGTTAAHAFSKAVSEAQYEYGHRGYTGTIAEKYEYIGFPLPEELWGKDTQEIITWCNRALSYRFNQEETPEQVRIGKRVEDKWGPAGCFPLPGEPDEKGELPYIFFGWASS